MARTDARQAVSLDEALWRAQAFAEAGADVIFIDALESVEEMAALCELGGAARWAYCCMLLRAAAGYMQRCAALLHQCLQLLSCACCAALLQRCLRS